MIPRLFFFTGDFFMVERFGARPKPIARPKGGNSTSRRWNFHRRRWNFHLPGGISTTGRWNFHLPVEFPPSGRISTPRTLGICPKFPGRWEFVPNSRDVGIPNSREFEEFGNLGSNSREFGTLGWKFHRAGAGPQIKFPTGSKYTFLHKVMVSCTHVAFLCLPCLLHYVIFIIFSEAAGKETASRSHAHGAMIASLVVARSTHNVMNIVGPRRAVKCSGGEACMHVLPCNCQTVAMEAHVRTYIRTYVRTYVHPYVRT